MPFVILIVAALVGTPYTVSKMEHHNEVHQADFIAQAAAEAEAKEVDAYLQDQHWMAKDFPAAFSRAEVKKSWETHRLAETQE